MKHFVNALASHEDHVVRCHLKRKAWAAGDKLKLTDLRNDARRVHALNFPNSKYAKGVNVEGKAWHTFW